MKYKISEISNPRDLELKKNKRKLKTNSSLFIISLSLTFSFILVCWLIIKKYNNNVLDLFLSLGIGFLSSSFLAFLLELSLFLRNKKYFLYKRGFFVSSIQYCTILLINEFLVFCSKNNIPLSENNITLGDFLELCKTYFDKTKTKYKLDIKNSINNLQENINNYLNYHLLEESNSFISDDEIEILEQVNNEISLLISYDSILITIDSIEDILKNLCKIKTFKNLNILQVVKIKNYYNLRINDIKNI